MLYLFFFHVVTFKFLGHKGETYPNMFVMCLDCKWQRKVFLPSKKCKNFSMFFDITEQKDMFFIHKCTGEGFVQFYSGIR